ncbi:MAG TPA: glycosyltransferase family 39 protein [Candidatus Udaeobacter sp.]|nr:glycosyltransferase family 39 protein [Candidatus Udaeobacter sp.]
MSRINSTTTKYAILFFGCVVFHILGTWSLPLIDRDEPRFAEASREMIERANYVVPYFNNQLRLDKPPLTYWAQVASYHIFGENDFAARFPSAIAAAGTALVILGWGRRIGGEKPGCWAAIIFTLSLQTFVHAKAAVADMWLVLFVTLANWAGYELIRGRTPNAQRPTLKSEKVDQTSNIEHQTSIWWLTFYISLAFGFLAKGPIAWTPLLTVAVVIIYTRDWLLVRLFKFAIGVMLMLAIIAVWGIPALIQTRGEFFAIGIGRHVVSRSFSTLEGHGASSFGMYALLLPFYFVTVFISFFPWSIKLPWLIRKLWRREESGVSKTGYRGMLIDTYLLTGIAIIFLIFTLVSTKLPHYTLPAFPLLALLLARYWQPAMAETRRSSFAMIAITVACVWIGIALVIPPMVARFFPAYQLFQVSRTSLQPKMQFAAVEFQEPSLVWYFRSRVQDFLTPLNRRRAVEFMSAPGRSFIVLPTSVAGEIFASPPASWRFFTVSGFNIAKGKRVDLTLVLKQE